MEEKVAQVKDECHSYAEEKIGKVRERIDCLVAAQVATCLLNDVTQRGIE